MWLGYALNKTNNKNIWNEIYKTIIQNILLTFLNILNQMIRIEYKNYYTWNDDMHTGQCTEYMSEMLRLMPSLR